MGLYKQMKMQTDVVGALSAIGNFRMIPNCKVDVIHQDDPIEESKDNIP